MSDGRLAGWSADLVLVRCSESIRLIRVLRMPGWEHFDKYFLIPSVRFPPSLDTTACLNCI